MPIYEFECNNCNKITQKYFPMKSKTKTYKCKYCGSKAKKILSTAIFNIKGFSEKNGYSKEKE